MSASMRKFGVNAILMEVHLSSLTSKHTPFLCRLAAEGALFEHAHSGSYATVPNRYELLTGRYVRTWNRGWEPLPKNETVASEELGTEGYASMLVLDTPNLLRDGCNYDRGYDAWEWIRSQEGDRYRTSPLHVDLPCSSENLRTNPWDPPKYYVDLDDQGYTGEEVIYPRYGSTNILSTAELHHCRTLNAAEITMVDRWLGKLLQAADDLGLRKSTAIIFISDHRFILGEHGWIDKGTFPLYEVLNHVPC